MRRVYIDNIKGNEILAKPIYSDNDRILLSQGVTLKLSYISKLKLMSIDYIYVEDDISEGIEIDDYINEKTRNKCKQEVKSVIDNYSTFGRAKIDSIAIVAQKVIEDILSSKEIIVNISDIRREDEETYAHSVNVCCLSVLTALKKGYTADKAKHLAIGALLHDLGKGMVPAKILNKIDKLTKDEFNQIKNHVIHGYEAIKDEQWLNAISKVVILTHHERINGSGYPFGWTGDKIHDSAKIVAICDVFDAMTNKKPYREAFKIYEVIEYLLAMKGTLFDPDIVDTFIRYIAVYPSGSGVIMNNGDKGIVIRQNNGLSTRPVIRLFTDKQGITLPPDTEVDLAQETTLFIIDTYEI